MKFSWLTSMVLFSFLLVTLITAQLTSSKEETSNNLNKKNTSKRNSDLIPPFIFSDSEELDFSDRTEESDEFEASTPTLFLKKICSYHLPHNVYDHVEYERRMRKHKYYQMSPNAPDSIKYGLKKNRPNNYPFLGDAMPRQFYPPWYPLKCHIVYKHDDDEEHDGVKNPPERKPEHTSTEINFDENTTVDSYEITSKDSSSIGTFSHDDSSKTSNNNIVDNFFNTLQVLTQTVSKIICKPATTKKMK